MLSLADIQGAPTDLNQLTLWAQRNGHLPPPAPPPETPPLVPPATVTAQMSPVATAQPKPEVPQMSSVTGTPDASHLGGMPGSEIGGAATAVKPMTPPVVGSAAESRGQLEDLEAKRKADTLASHDTFLGKLGHIAGRVGSIAGAAVAPGVTAMIPGSQLNLNEREAGLKGELAKRTAAEGVESERTAREKNMESEEALRGIQGKEAQAKLDKEQTEQNLITDTDGNVTGWKSGDGSIHAIDAPETPQAIKDVAAETTAKSIKPSIEKMDNGDIVAVTPGKNGAPATSQVVYHGDPKLETDLTQRTINGQEHHILVNKKTGEDIKDLGAFKTETSPAAALAAEMKNEKLVIAYDKDNKAHLMSRAEAKEAGLGHIQEAQPGDYDKAKTHHVVLNTLQTQLNSVVDASKALDQGLVQRGIIASALSHPTDSTIDSAMRAAVMSGATEQTQEYVRAVRALREAGLALPKEITGGSRVSEVQASALWQTMPSANSLNSKYALKQAQKFQQDIDRLRERAPEVRGQAIVDPDEAIKSKGTEKQHAAGGGGGQTVKFGGQDIPVNADGTVDIPGKGKYKVTPGSKDLVKVK